MYELVQTCTNAYGRVRTKGELVELSELIDASRITMWALLFILLIFEVGLVSILLDVSEDRSLDREIRKEQKDE